MGLINKLHNQGLILRLFRHNWLSNKLFLMKFEKEKRKCANLKKITSNINDTL